jgi:hypothetical protein
MTLTVTAKFTPTNVPAGATYAGLRFVLTDSAGTSQTTELPATDAPVTEADGSLALVAVFSGAAAPGAATIVVTALAADGSTLGTAFSGSGVVPSTFPQVIAVTFS